MGVYKYDYNWNFFTDSEQMYYFLGFIAADGYISDSSIEIGVNIQDRYLLEQFRDWIVPDMPLHDKPNTNSVTLKLNCRNRVWMFKSFFNMTTNKKGLEIRYPNCIPDQYTKDFIRGIIDGNGSIGIQKAYRGEKVYYGPRLRIFGNKNFMEDINDQIKRFILHKVTHAHKKGRENVYYLDYNFKTARNILHWVYDNNQVCLLRKYNRFIEVDQLR